MVCCCIVWVLYLVSCVTQPGAPSHTVEVVQSGAEPWQPGNLAMVLYLELQLQYRGTNRFRKVHVQVAECCEVIADDDTDCDVIRPHGATSVTVRPGQRHNVTLIYPTLYGYNRRGDCVVEITLYHPTRLTRHRLDFDTSLPSAQQCDSPDKDPLDACLPVKCNVKYAGLRNFYNKEWKRCQTVPSCVADPRKPLPDVAYVPTSNSCKDLETPFKDEDLEHISQGYVRGLETEADSTRMNCHHGAWSKIKQTCVCERGWKSDTDSFAPTGVVDMCNVRCHETRTTDLEPRFSVDPVSVALALIIAFTQVLLVGCCELHGCFLLLHDRKDSQGGQKWQDVVYFPVGDEYSSHDSQVHEPSHNACTCQSN